MRFWDSMAGRTFTEHTVPQIAKALNKIADKLETEDSLKAKVEELETKIKELEARIEELYGN